MVFSMARDRVLPFSRQLSAVSPKTHTPILPAVVVGLLAIAILVLNIFQPSMYTALASVCIMLLYIAYLMVTLPLLRRRLQGWPAVGAPQGRTASGQELFSLGRLGIPLNVLAVLWGAGMTLNLAWPRDAIYNPVGEQHWYLKWFALVFLVFALGVGALAYWRQRWENQRVLDALDPDGATAVNAP
jgi:amino acid transporter